MADNMECGGEKLLTESGLKYMLKKMTGKIMLAVGVVRAEGDAPLSLWREETDDGITIRGSVDLSDCAASGDLEKEAGARAKADAALQSAVESKQDKLTAGDNITISEDNVISATGGSGDADLSDYQKKLKAYAETEASADAYNGVTAKLGGTEISFVNLLDTTGNLEIEKAAYLNGVAQIGTLGTIGNLGYLGTLGTLTTLGNIAEIGSGSYSTKKTDVFNPWYYHGSGDGDTTEIATKGDIPDVSEYLTKTAAEETYQGKLNYYSEGNQCAYVGGANNDKNRFGRVEVDMMGEVLLQTGNSGSKEHELILDRSGNLTLDKSKVLTEGDGLLISDLDREHLDELWEWYQEATKTVILPEIYFADLSQKEEELTDASLISVQDYDHMYHESGTAMAIGVSLPTGSSGYYMYNIGIWFDYLRNDGNVTLTDGAQYKCVYHTGSATSTDLGGTVSGYLADIDQSGGAGIGHGDGYNRLYISNATLVFGTTPSSSSDGASTFLELDLSQYYVGGEATTAAVYANRYLRLKYMGTTQPTTIIEFIGNITAELVAH